MSLNAPADLQNILEVPASVTSGQLQVFLNFANLVITEQLANVTPPLSVARQTTIELLLAAHFALMLTERGGLTSSKAASEAQDTYVASIFNGAKGFATTRYGIQAIAFDTSGTLQSMSTSKLQGMFRTVANRTGWDPFTGSGWPPQELQFTPQPPQPPLVIPSPTMAPIPDV